MLDNKVSFNNMPEALAVVLSKLDALGEKVDKLVPTPQTEEPQWFDLSALVEYLPNHPAEQTVYGWTSARKIPFYKKGKNVLFNKKEIDAWLKGSTCHKSEQDLEKEAESFVKGKRNGKK